MAPEKPGVVRILVCGNTGVGKSTLIKETFGEEAVLDRARGVHDISHPITLPSRPDLIVHESGDFESGGSEELQQIKDFVVAQSNKAKIKDRLHVVWFCFETNSPRDQQRSAIEFFMTVSQQSKIPIIVVQTKKDEFLDLQYCEASTEFDKEADPKAYADEELRKRTILLGEELSHIKDGRCDAIVTVSQDEKASIDLLTEETTRCLDHESVRRAYIAAQVRRTGLKVDLALTRMMQEYKAILISTGCLAVYAGGRAAHYVHVTFTVCKAVVKAFCPPTTSPNTIEQIAKRILWADMGHSIRVLWTDPVAVAGILTYLFYDIPFCLAFWITIPPLLLPATAERLLMFSCDLTLVLARAFKTCASKGLSQPLEQDIEEAAQAYRPIMAQVHGEIKELLPAKNLYRVFQASKIEVGLRTVVDKYVGLFAEQPGFGAGKLGEGSASWAAPVEEV